MKTYTLSELTDKYVGEEGSPQRKAFAQEFALEVLCATIKQLRQEQHLTQEELGKLVGVQKAQISKIENHITQVRLSSLLKVFRGLGMKVTFQLENLVPT